MWLLNPQWEEMKALSPKDTKCKFCGRRFTARGVLEHERHHCAKNPNRRPREFKKSRCRHCGKTLHGNGLRAHVAQVHPEAYARSRSVRAHRMKEKRSVSASASARKEGQRKQTRQRMASSHAPHSRESSAAPRKGDWEARSRHQPETRAETTGRIWKEVLKRTPTHERIPPGNWRRGDQERA